MSTVFDSEKLVHCAEHYCLGDQELSVSVAYEAAETIYQEPFLIVYEDVMSHGPTVQQELVKFLGLVGAQESDNIFVDHAQTKKLHTELFCDNPYVDCDELTIALHGHYPCLLKQLKRESEGLVWTVPLQPNGKIDIRGDCFPLSFLNKEGQTRKLEELYQIPRLKK